MYSLRFLGGAQRIQACDLGFSQSHVQAKWHDMLLLYIKTFYPFFYVYMTNDFYSFDWIYMRYGIRKKQMGYSLSHLTLAMWITGVKFHFRGWVRNRRDLVSLWRKNKNVVQHIIRKFQSLYRNDWLPLKVISMLCFLVPHSCIASSDYIECALVSTRGNLKKRFSLDFSSWFLR